MTAPITGSRSGPDGRPVTSPTGPAATSVTGSATGSAAASPAAPAAGGAGQAAPGHRPGRARWCLGTRLLVAATLTWAVFLALHAVLSGRWWLWLVVELAPPILLVVVPSLLLAVTPLAARRVRLPLALTQAAMLAVGLAAAGLTLPAPAAGGVPDLKVFAWNTDYWHQDDDPERFYAYLRAQRADVYLLQEYLNFTDRPIRIDELDRIRAEFPGYHVAVASELITISRVPIVAWRPIDASPRLPAAEGVAPPAGTDWRDYYTTKALRTDLRVGERLVSLYNVHLAVQIDLGKSPLSSDFYRFVHGQFHRRAAQLETLHADLAANPNPVLVAGDFNATSWMRELRTFCDTLRCHDPVRPSWLPASWPARGLPRLWRLDWIFSRGDVTVADYRFLPGGDMSDHLPQRVWLSVP